MTKRRALLYLATAAVVCTGLIMPRATAQAPATAAAGTGTVRGTVTDDTGGIIPGATVTLNGSGGALRTVRTQDDGTYVIRALAPGNYSLVATFQGLVQQKPLAVAVGARAATANIVMTVQSQREEITVAETLAPTLSVDPSNNASSLVLHQEELEALPDDPDDLQADLQALAGPSAGPSGGQIYIDGFTGGNFPPKESIREIRINQNPFSAEYDRLGFGRIEILTKPGSDKFHGQGLYSVSDQAFDARNPFLTSTPKFRTQLYSASLSGPISKRSSFFVDADRRTIDDNAVIVAQTLTSDLLPTTVNNALPTPQVRLSFSPRVDYQINTNNTLSLRYSFFGNKIDAAFSGAGGNGSNGGNYLLPANAFSQKSSHHQLQLTETAVLTPRVVNETRFRFNRDLETQNPFTNAPEVNVQGAFIDGGATVGRSHDLEDSYEFQNYTSIAAGTHATKFGARIRAAKEGNTSPQSFNGVYTFGGGVAPVLDANNVPVTNPATGQIVTSRITSLEQYRRTLVFQQQGLTPSAIRALGGGATNFRINGGNPTLTIHQIDWGLFIQDDWRLRPNFTLSTGLRYEGQTNNGDHADWAPRIGFAWSPKTGGGGRAKTVIRGGFGLFYDRFRSGNYLTAVRYNGFNQQQYNVVNPDTFPLIPALSQLSPITVSRVYQIDKALQAPQIIQSAVGVERQVVSGTTVAVNYTFTRGNHQFRTRDINAPIPGLGVRPYPNAGDIFEYESNGILKQHQIFLSLNSRIGRRLSLFGGYVYNNARSDTDGIGTLPANQYDLRSEFGRSGLDIHHRLFLGGSVSGPLRLRFAPFLVARSGSPFNITTGSDLFNDGIFTARPGLASGPGPGVFSSPDYGYFNLQPKLTDPVIARNYGNGPASVSLNLRVSRTWGFGAPRASASRQRNFQGGPGGPPGGGFGGGFGGGGGHGGGGGEGRGMGGLFSDSPTEHRYNVTLAISARNILNHTNLSTPIGALTSPTALQSIGIAGGYGPENTSSTNRRIDLQLRFQF